MLTAGLRDWYLVVVVSQRLWSSCLSLYTYWVRYALTKGDNRQALCSTSFAAYVMVAVISRATKAMSNRSDHRYFHNGLTSLWRCSIPANSSRTGQGSQSPSDSQMTLPNGIPAIQTYVPYHLCLDHHSKIYGHPSDCCKVW